MSLTPGCPRCPTPVAQVGPEVSCPEHGVISPVWRAEAASYDGFVDHLALAGTMPTLLPWPLGTEWNVGDFAVVPEVATLTAVRGPTDGGDVDLTLVVEQPGTGLGARVAGTSDPAEDLAYTPAHARVRIAGQAVSLWALDTGGTELDRTVLVGEHGGRWLWLILRPASALLLMGREWHLRDVSALGMSLVELPFGGPAGAW
ncbi:MAG TPA: DUF6758 family protein [Nocardioides sp.]|nr:DUF6758 family protein [Nocardioides sp.]